MSNKITMPWEERPAGCKDVMWRYSENPVIDRYHIPSSNSIFNSAVVPFKDGYAGVFRCDNRAVQMNIFAGFSKDGIHWEIEHEPIKFKAGNTDMIESEYKYDPRVTWIEDRYWITWCNGYYGPTIGIGYTFDFKEFFQCENAFLPFNRNGVLLPQKFDGKYALLSRPSDSGHTPFGDIYISFSPDMKFWGEHRHVMAPTPFPESAWQCTKIGAGSVPFLTDEGWLMFYHGVKPLVTVSVTPWEQLFWIRTSLPSCSTAPVSICLRLLLLMSCKVMFPTWCSLAQRCKMENV